MDDLGTVDSLVQPLLEGSADQARTALLTYVRRLGAMHADTAGRQREYDEIADSLQAPPKFRTAQSKRDDDLQSAPGPGGTQPPAGRPARCPGWGRRSSTRSSRSVRPCANPATSPFLLHRDACPDNMAFGTDRLRLIDFEFTRFGHALIDGLYPQIPFPTCWCCNVIPDGLADELTAAYRAELARGCPAAADDAVFARASAHVTAWWLLCSFDWPFENALTAGRHLGHRHLPGTRAHPARPVRRHRGANRRAAGTGRAGPVARCQAAHDLAGHRAAAGLPRVPLSFPSDHHETNRVRPSPTCARGSAVTDGSSRWAMLLAAVATSPNPVASSATLPG